MSSTEIARSNDEIIRYYKKVAPYDFFGVWGSELLLRVELREAIPFMKEDHGWDEESWKKSQRKRDRESVIYEMEDFIQDAIEKCFRHQKSCIVSLDYYRAWTWLIKDMDLFSFLIEDRNFPNFGAPMINAVIEKYHFEELLPDREINKSMFLNMAQGRKCNDLCHRGCAQGNPNFFQKKLIVPSQPKTSTLITPKDAA